MFLLIQFDFEPLAVFSLGSVLDIILQGIILFSKFQNEIHLEH